MAERLHFDCSGTTEAPIEVESLLRVIEEQIPEAWRNLCLNVNNCPLAKKDRKYFEEYCANKGEYKDIPCWLSL